MVSHLPIAWYLYKLKVAGFKMIEYMYNMLPESGSFNLTIAELTKIDNKCWTSLIYIIPE